MLRERCDGTCVACVGAATGATDGTCTAVTAGTDPAQECAATDPTLCGVAGLGFNGDAVTPSCALYSATTQCAFATCSDGLATPDAFCNGTGVCAAPSSGTCAPYLCGATACEQSCSSSAQCASGFYCDGGACLAVAETGNACTTAEQCRSGACVDGVCCSTACDGGCGVCSVAAGASADGT